MFYGWKLATIGSCGNLLLQGSVFYTMNAFIEPLVELHGWSRAGIGLSMTFASAMMTLSMPIGIMLTNKMSIRILMTLGAFIGGLSYVGLGYVDDIRLFAALFAIVWVCGQICGGVVATMLMNRWFAAYRGRAFGAGQHGDFPVRGVPAVRGPRAGGHAGRFMGVFDTRRARLPAFSPLLADYPQYARRYRPDHRRRGGEPFRGGTGRGKGGSHELAGAGGQPPDVDHRRIVRHRPDGRSYNFV